MAGSRVEAVETVLREAAGLHERTARDAAAVVAVAEVMTAVFDRGGQALIFGNGGSAADAQHFACELVGRFLRERRALAAVALTTDSSIVTAIANDYGFDRVFVRQIEALGGKGDVAIGFSTSGSSRNVLAGLEYARSAGLKTIAFTGASSGAMAAVADVVVQVPHDSTPRIQEVHRTLIHAVCELIESDLIANP
jgi:D-sedoheptulose 7-phosphate isomerase